MVPASSHTRGLLCTFNVGFLPRSRGCGIPYALRLKNARYESRGSDGLSHCHARAMASLSAAARMRPRMPRHHACEKKKVGVQREKVLGHSVNMFISQCTYFATLNII